MADDVLADVGCYHDGCRTSLGELLKRGVHVNAIYSHHHRSSLSNPVPRRQSCSVISVNCVYTAIFYLNISMTSLNMSYIC